MKFRTTYKKLLVTFFVLLFSVLVLVLWNEIIELRNKNKADSELLLNDLSRIKRNGILRAAVDYNSTNYFIYRGRPMGFEYELLKALCNDLGVKLEIVVTGNLTESFEGLKKGRFDVVAQNITVTKQRKEEMNFTFPFEQVCQVLVQRENNGNTTNNKFVGTSLELANRKVHVQKNSAYYQRLLNLSDEIGGDIQIITDSIHGTEDLIAKVAKGEIDFTVCDEHIAKLNKNYYPNLDVSVPVSLPQNIAWAVRKGSAAWKQYLDNWIVEYKNTRVYKQLWYRYFESPRVVERKISDLNSITGGKISQYDKVIKEVAREYKWDWRLIAAIIYNESRFNEEAGSWTGAYGLMQIMPATAEAFGVENIENPKQNIKGGIMVLNSLNKQFVESIPDSTERVKFILAAYNVGLGHVNDAQRLAEKFGKNPMVWENNVDFFLAGKSEEKYFKDTVVRWGYCRGEEATNFVENVTTLYRHYLNVIN